MAANGMEVTQVSELSGFGTIQVTKNAMRTRNASIADFLSYKAAHDVHLNDFILALQETSYWTRLQYDDGCDSQYIQQNILYFFFILIYMHSLVQEKRRERQRKNEMEKEIKREIERKR
jgi:hypothetical protein